MKSINLFVLFFVSINIHAVDNLRIPDIRSLGMGGNGVTQSVLFNPALVALHTDKIIHLEYFNRYGVKELGTVGIGFVYPNPLLSVGVDISSFGYDQYRETLFRLSVGKRLNDRWRIGIGFQYKMLQTELYEEVPKQLSTDIGILFAPVDKLLIGMLIMDFPSIAIHKHTAEIKCFTGYSVQIGFQWEVINGLLIAGTVGSNKTHVLTGGAGIEYAPFGNFRIRAGVQTTPLLPTLGIGYRLVGFTVDVATVYHPVLGVSTGLGLSYSF